MRLCLVDADELARWTRSKLLWVHQKLLNKVNISPSVREPEFVSGESFRYLGRSYRLKIIRGAAESLRFDGKNFLLGGGTRSKAADHFKRWYIQTGRVWLRERVSPLSRKLEVAAGELMVAILAIGGDRVARTV